MATIGYARVSTGEQNLDLQLSALRDAGCDRLFSDDGISATVRKRPGFEKAIASLESGDTLLVWKMDRAFRSVLHAASMLEELELHGISLECITETMDTATAMGRCMYHVRNAFAEWEREVISERTIAGLAAARARGVRLGRPRALTPKQVSEVKSKIRNNVDLTYHALAREYAVSTRTLLRSIRRNDG